MAEDKRQTGKHSDEPADEQATAAKPRDDARGEAKTAAAHNQDQGSTAPPNEAEDLRNQLLRVSADFENFKRRVEGDRARTVQVARTDVILDLLPVIDNFDRAFADVPKEIEGGNWHQGIQAIKQQFEGILQNLGIERIESVGKEFDPELHEAVSHEPAKEKKGIIFKEFEAGYRLGDQVIRHARVAVSSGQSSDEKVTQSNKEND